MPTKNAIHIPVDTLEIVGGPGLDDLKRIADILERNRLQKVPKLVFTFRSAASHQTFHRKVEINSISFGYADSMTAAAVFVLEVSASLSGEAVSEPIPPADTSELFGFIGDWFFSAQYDFHARTGSANSKDLDDYLGYAD